MDRWPADIDGPTRLTCTLIDETLSTEYGGYEATRPADPRTRREFDLSWEYLENSQYGTIVDFLEAQRWSAYPFEWPYPIAEFGISGYADPSYGAGGFGAGGFGEGLIYAVKLVSKSFRAEPVTPGYYNVSCKLREI